MYSNEAMDRFRQFGALALLLLFSVAPAMACLIPGAAMTAEERACCQRMGPACGQPEMPASHSCCRGMLPDAGNKALDAQTATAHLFAVAAIPLTGSGLVDSVLSASAVTGSADFSSLGSPPSTISVLRI